MKNWGLYGGLVGNGRPMKLADGTLDPELVTLYAEYPHWAVPIGPIQQSPDIIAEIDDRNRDQVRLGYSLAGGADPSRITQASTFYGRQAAVVEKYRGWLSYSGGVIDSVSNVNFAAPGLAGHLAQFYAHEYMNTPGLKGLFFDVLPYLPPVNQPDLVLNQMLHGTRLATTAPYRTVHELVEAWMLGFDEFLRTARALMPDAILVQNWGNLNAPECSSMREDFPSQVPEGTYSTAMLNSFNGLMRYPQRMPWLKTDDADGHRISDARMALALAWICGGVATWCPSHPAFETGYYRWRLPEYSLELDESAEAEQPFPGVFVRGPVAVNLRSIAQRVPLGGSLITMAPNSCVFPS